MDKPPRSQKETLLNRKVVIKGFFWYGMLESIAAMGAYFFVNILNGWPRVPLAGSGTVYRQATTLTLAAIVFCQIGMVLNCRTEKQSVFKVGLFNNRRVLQGIAIEIILIALLIYVPGLEDIFGTAPIGLKEWIFLIILPPLILGIEEIRKAISRSYDRMKERNGV
jgi:magnesium-transporting ATPase (P-type)